MSEYDLELALANWLRYGGEETFGEHLSCEGWDVEEPELSEPDFIKAYALIRGRLYR